MGRGGSNSDRLVQPGALGRPPTRRCTWSKRVPDKFMTPVSHASVSSEWPNKAPVCTRSDSPALELIVAAGCRNVCSPLKGIVMSTKWIRRQLVGALLACPILLGISSFVGADGAPRTFGQKITVYKSPTCGCCQGWVDYLKDNGFMVESVNTSKVHEIKQANGLTDPRLTSCHTALVDGYVVEGHVPADDIWRLLSERPPGVVGITAPGMPQMSPGMNSIEPRGYDVLSVESNGQVSVFSRY